MIDWKLIGPARYERGRVHFHGLTAALAINTRAALRHLYRISPAGCGLIDTVCNLWCVIV
jgi:hypothetical protein